jgi:hypothetical protein
MCAFLPFWDNQERQHGREATKFGSEGRPRVAPGRARTVDRRCPSALVFTLSFISNQLESGRGI